MAVEPGVAPAMARRIAHRGPDDHGFLSFGAGGVRLERDWTGTAASADAVLIHRRLSILDLAPSGWQPMATEDGRYHIVFNGEVYNYVEIRAELKALGHSFRSSSDTEVLLKAYAEWGTGALSRLVGMFAFAVLDARTRRLLLARDPFGIKPLYYTLSPRAFGFASEIKALLELPGVGRGVNPQRLYEYLNFGHSSYGDETLFADVRQLPPAHYMEVGLDTGEPLDPVRYWRLDLDRRLDLSFDQAAEQLRGLFLDSVRLHLRSDVPVGAALSGGVDSSAIVMGMRHAEGPDLRLHTFTYLAEDEAINEQRWAEIVGKAARAEMHSVRPVASDLVADLDRLIATQDEPFISTSMYAQFRVFRLAAEAGIKVMLDGQGADEMLGGYPVYTAARFASLVRQGSPVAAMQFARRSSRLPGRGGLLMRAGEFLAPAALHRPLRRLAGRDLVPAWLRGSWFAERGVRVRAPNRLHRTREVLKQELHQTLVHTSLPMLLRYEDRNSMAFSIESRVPFLDTRIADFMFALPEEYLISPEGTTKAVFREAMRGIVPAPILDRSDKIGLLTPEQAWLSTLRPWVEGVLGSPVAAAVPALDRVALSREWDDVLAGRKRFDSRVWRWVNLIRWADLYQVDFGARS
jgi:asparagine synthase (glutamine-hydrolysing)